MRAIVIVAVVLALLAVSTRASGTQKGAGKKTSSSSKIDALWKKWKKQHKIVFKNAAAEKRRFKIWKANLMEAIAHNKQKDTHEYEAGLSKRTIYTKEEKLSYLVDYSQFHGPKRQASTYLDHMADLTATASIPTLAAKQLPKSVNWVKRGKVGPVRNQGGCGSCSAHAATGALEAAWAIKSGKLTPLAVQQPIDCLFNHCNGIPYEDVVTFATENHGLPPWSSYKFNKKNSMKTPASAFTCKRGMPTVGAFQGLVKIAHDPLAMMTWLAKKGPVIVTVDATHLDNYRKGVFTRCTANPKKQNHAVLIVGYATLHTKKGYVPVWDIKNSWDKDWGVKGHFYVKRSGNSCGINLNPVGVVV
jgi:hypothetical protein